MLVLTFTSEASAATCNVSAGGTVAWPCGAGDDVTISNGTNVTVSGAKTVNALTLSGGTVSFTSGASIADAGALTVNGSSTVTGAGTLTVTGAYASTVTFNVSDAADLVLNGGGNLGTGSNICLSDSTASGA